MSQVGPHSRKLHASSSYKWDPIEIPLKWGVLRGKRLRKLNENVAGSFEPIVKILGIHGWLDNCNSFDKLIPFFSSKIDFVVLDLPGHGFSDHLPPGARYDQVTYVYSVKDAISYLQWSSCIYLGHSMGGSIGHLIAGLFPKLIAAFISIDYLGYKGILGHPSIEGIREEALEFYRLENQISSPPKYSKEEALKRFMNARTYRNSTIPYIDSNAAEILIERAIKPVQNMNGLYTWRHDQKVKVRWFNVLGYQSMYELVSSLKCPILLIKSLNGLYVDYGPTELNESNLIDAYSEKSKSFQYVKVPGDHYPHLTNTAEVASVINSFIDEVHLNSKL